MRNCMVKGCDNKLISSRALCEEHKDVLAEPKAEPALNGQTKAYRHTCSRKGCNNDIWTTKEYQVEMAYCSLACEDADAVLAEPKEEPQLHESVNNGGSTDYYKIPVPLDEEGNPKKVFEAQDVIEHREMNYAQGNIFKASFCFNAGRHEGTDEIRELNKIIYFAQREIERLKKQKQHAIMTSN